MKNFFKKIIVFSIVPIIFMIGMMLYNFFVDPFGVFKGDISKQANEPNQHYLKVNYIMNNPNKYNAFLFGNSRVGKIDVSKIKGDDKWYNMTYSEGLPGEHLDNIKLFIKKNVKIDKIVVGVDEISAFTKKEGHENESIRKPYKNRFDPLLSYLFLKPSYNLAEEIVNMKEKKFYEEGMYATIYETGSFPPNKKDKYIDQNKDLHKEDPIFENPYWPGVRVDNMQQCLNDIIEIKQLCEDHNIEVRFFVNPIYKKTYEKAVSKGFLTFLDELKNITDFYNFNKFKKITSDPVNYYENSHYRPLVGDLIVEEFFNK